MTDQIQRMFSEALDRINDADILAGSLESQSDSQAIIRILAFEVLLKCALLVGGQKAKANHNYNNHWLRLPGYVQQEIMEVAVHRRCGYADLSNLEKLFKWYQFIFEKARYHYELYENYSLAEQAELENFGIQLEHQLKRQLSNTIR